MDSRDRRRNEERIDDGSGGWNLEAYSRPSSNGRICRCRRDRKTRSSRNSQNSIRRRLRAASRRHRDEIGGSSRDNGLSKVSKNSRLYKNRSSRASTQRTSSSRSRDSSRSGSRRSSRASSRKNGKKIYRRRTQATVAAAAAPRLKAALKKKAVLNQNRRVNHGARRVSFTSNRNVIRNEAANNANNASANNGTTASTAAAAPAYFRALPLPPRYVRPRYLRDEEINNDPAPTRNVNRAHQVPPLGPIINGFQTATRHPHGNYYVPPPPTPAQGFDENDNLHQRGPSTRAPHYVAELGRRLERAEQLRDENIERYYENNRHLYLGQPTQLNFDESDDEMPVATNGQEYNDTSEEDSVTSDWGSTRPNRPNFSHLVGQGPAKPKGISALWQEQHPGWEDGRYHIDRITLPFESQSPSALPRRSSASRDQRDSSRRCSRRCSTSSSRQYSPHQNRRQSSSRRQEPPLISRASPRHPAASSGSVIFGGSRQSRRRN